MQYYLGVDIGTTSVKAVAFSTSGEILASWSSSYKMYHPKANWSEQNPKEVFNAVIISTNKVIATLSSYLPAFVSFSSALHGMLVMDKEGKPITDCIIWADNRAGEIADDLKNTAWGKEIYQITGVPVHAMSPLCKLVWLKEYKPGIFNKAFKFISIKEYVFYRIFNQYVIDTSVASGTGLLNIKNLAWDENILNFLEITSSYLSKVVSTKSKFIYKKSASHNTSEEWLMPDEVPFIIGGSDGALANLGAGAMSKNSMAVSIGTSSAARIVIEQAETDIKMRTFCYHLKDEFYIFGGAGNNGAVVIEWLRDIFLETKETFSELFDKADTIKSGSEGLIFIPYILGERAPLWNSKACGIFYGLNKSHTKAHLIRACMEGVMYALYSIAKILLEKREITEIYATGGFTHSDLWIQMLADVCNVKVLVADAVESSALGAVMIGMEAMEMESFGKKATLSSYEPNLLNHEIYMRSFEKFERIYEALKAEINSEIISLHQMEHKQ